LDSDVKGFLVKHAISALGVLLLPVLVRAADPFSDKDWLPASPESQGMSSAKLDALWNKLASSHTTGLLILHNDRVVFERYAQGWSAQRPHGTASMAKALVGGLSLAVALSDGRIALDDKTAQYIPQWKNTPGKAAITIRHLGSHVSGIEDAEQAPLPHDKLTGWKGDFWKRLPTPNDPFTLARDTAAVLSEPGTKFTYSNPGMAMLSYAVTAALRNAPQKDIRSLLRDRVMRPIGVPDQEWSIGYGQTFQVDGLPLVPSWGGGSYTPRAVARVAQLMLQRGNWQGKQILTEQAVAQTTSDAGTPGIGAMGWWSNNDGRYPNLPNDSFWGSGAGHQAVLVVPSLKLIAVRTGEVLQPGVEHHDALNKFLFEPLLDTIAQPSRPQTGAPPYPRSPVITRLDWDPKETIRRAAQDSDNWPLTWGNDDRLYTAYGDGTGFDPKVPQKLSLGIARIEGGPIAFTGFNIRSMTIEQKGNGQAGKKASGILMVDGGLYLWVRNAGNSQLAWSKDHGQSWTWSDWKFTTSFGCPCFLNFGKNYAGARDDFVYVYSHDHASAYQPADRMVLARVRKDRLVERSAYEFFKGFDASGQPSWTKDIRERGAVFEHAERCYRSTVSYHAGLKRYLWCQTLPSKDPRFQGGFGIYDAPEPWGPWTTVYFTENWDVGPGETAGFPTKWMSPDGTTLYLVFSGNDSFSVRKATLTVAGKKKRS
jgi:CubicO group peptidase (beta-lactamase class C family)